jgi:hypothetical protein
MEYLIEHIDDFLNDISDFADDAFIIFDCPG